MGDLESSCDSSTGFTKIDVAVESLRRSDVFHVVKEVLGFILYMHQQIPTDLQQLELEFDDLKKEYKQLELSHNSQLERKERKASRKTNKRKIEVKSAIKKLEKLINSISILLSALQEAIDGIPGFQGVTFLLGGSLARPRHVYEILFSHFKLNSDSLNDNAKSKAAEALSRKAIRALISTGAGSSFSSILLQLVMILLKRYKLNLSSKQSPFLGPTKVFLLIKCPSTFKSPLHFLPKRDFRYNKKVLPIKLNIRCKFGDRTMNDMHDNPVNDEIWYHCRHIVRGLAVRSEETEC